MDMLEEENLGLDFLPKYKLFIGHCFRLVYGNIGVRYRVRLIKTDHLIRQAVNRQQIAILSSVASYKML